MLDTCEVERQLNIANEKEGPGDIISLNAQKVHEKREDTEDDGSGAELADANKMKKSRGVAGRLLRDFAPERIVQHGRSGINSEMTQNEK